MQKMARDFDTVSLLKSIRNHRNMFELLELK